MAATAGLATIYGLLFANLLLAPLLPHLAAQSNSPTNNAPTNSVHRDVYYDNNEFRDANSREDCDRILQEVLDKIKEKTKEIDAAWKAAEECDITYAEQLTTNNVNYNRTLAEDRSTVNSLFLTCMGLGVGAGAASSVKKVTWTIRGGLTVVVRVGAAAIGTVVTIGATAYCISLRNSTAESLRESRDAVKEDADSRALRARDTCREDTNYARVKRRHANWWRTRGGKRGPGGYGSSVNRAKADHARCLALFPSGDCGTTD